jgi:hypothetical protein
MTNIGKKFYSSEIGQREFNTRETLILLKHTNFNIFASWGVEKALHLFNKALALKINSHHWQAFVVVTLAWNDTYSFFLVDEAQIIRRETHHVHFDELQARIDEQTEKIDEYKF